jgi:hypothetical protein
VHGGFEPQAELIGRLYVILQSAILDLQTQLLHFRSQPFNFGTQFPHHLQPSSQAGSTRIE